MALFFHSDDVDDLIPFREAVSIAENALKALRSPKGTNAPRNRIECCKRDKEVLWVTGLIFA